MLKPRVLIVSENISMKMGGESSLPYYYAKLFRLLGTPVLLACHERVRDELERDFPDLADSIYYVADSGWQRFLFNWSKWMPYRLRDLLVGQLIHFSTQWRLRKRVLELAKHDTFDVVLEPSPITPKGLSFMYDLGKPVVIGPMCGGMEFPPAFRSLDSVLTRIAVGVSRAASHALNLLFPGKIKADVLLVANDSTRRALPYGVRGDVQQVFESGVDLRIWSSESSIDQGVDDRNIKFMFSGRFVDWKGIQFLLPAFELALERAPNIELDLIGGGGEYEGIVRRMAEGAKLSGRVRIHGWVRREEAAEILRKADVFVMPSLRECGGTAILEAMALGKPVISTNWGGPADYVNERCGILVDPISEEAFVSGLADAMILLAKSPEARAALSEGARERVKEDFLTWEDKAEHVLKIIECVHTNSVPI